MGAFSERGRVGAEAGEPVLGAQEDGVHHVVAEGGVEHFGLVIRVGHEGLLDEHARHCVMGAADDQRGAKTEELMAAVGRLMRRG